MSKNKEKNEVNPQKVVEILGSQLADKDVQIAMLQARISDLEEVAKK